MNTLNRTERSFAVVDAMSPPLRACVHEYGYAIVAACLKHGVNRPAQIHDLVREIWAGARQPAQRNNRGLDKSLDWLLAEAGSSVTAATLVRFLWSNNLVIMPRDATTHMIEASMETVSRRDVIVTKYEKHRRRLNAATLAYAKRFWPQLFKESA